MNYFEVLGISIEDLTGQDESALNDLVSKTYTELYRRTVGAYANVPRTDGRTQAQWQVILNTARDTLSNPQRRQAHIIELTAKPKPTEPPTNGPRGSDPAYLNVETARRLILNGFSGQVDVQTRDIIAYVEQHHCEGNKYLSDNEKMIVQDALSSLRKKDRADNPRRGYWSFYNPSEFSGEWTAERIRNLVSEEIRDYHEANFSEERCNVFYRTVAETQNLIKTEDWRLKPKFRKNSCRFWLTDKGVTQVKSVFGIHLQYNPFTLHIRAMKKDAEELKRQYRCEFSSVTKNRSADYIYYHIPDDIKELRPVLEFAYKKHTGN